jgi:hypothetical protein
MAPERSVGIPALQRGEDVNFESFDFKLQLSEQSEEL